MPQSESLREQQLLIRENKLGADDVPQQLNCVPTGMRFNAPVVEEGIAGTKGSSKGWECLSQQLRHPPVIG